MRLEEKRWVERPQGEVFEYTADFSNIQDWDPGVVASRKLTPGTVGKGTEFELEVKFGSGTIPMIYEITEYDPNSKVVLVGRGEKLEAVDEIRFDTQDNMTAIYYTADLTFRNYYKYLGPLLSKPLKKVGTQALDGLATQLNR
ncbi:MAG TPA: SRPBCC family protein [Acidimicrobiia bacterium]